MKMTERQEQILQMMEFVIAEADRADEKGDGERCAWFVAISDFLSEQLFPKPEGVQ